MLHNYDGLVRGLDGKVNGGGHNGRGTNDVEGAMAMTGSSMVTNAAGGAQGDGGERWKREQQRRREPAPPGSGAARAEAAADRWAEEQMFEEDLRAVLSMMRPNRRERLLGWSEYRTGGAHFRVTVSWDEEFETVQGQAGAGRARGPAKTRIPHLADVIEALLVGSALHDDDLTAEQEFDLYRGVLREVYRRLDDLQACYE